MDEYGWVIENYGWLPELLDDANITDDTRDARIIADVATDPGDDFHGTPPRVLHVAVGTFRHVVVAYQKPDGEWHLAVGPAYGYYEFALEGFTRMTDGEWKDRLETEPPPPPSWTSDFLA
jgi:hypothetical protein